MELIFVYNAKTDALSAIADYAHKVFSPSTYACELCALTHHNLGERKAWKTFKRETSVELSFWYIRQFEKEFSQTAEYPIVFRKDGDELVEVLNKVELSQISDVEALIESLISYIRIN